MQQVISELERLRRRSRAMLIVQRASVVVAWTIAALAALILLDFGLRLPSAFRLVLLLAGAATLIYVLWTYLRLAVAFSPSLTQLALRVEQVMPAVAGRLASSVEFAAGGIDQTNPMAARSVRETERRLSGESVSHVINSKRTWRDLAIMLGAVGVATLVAINNPSFASTGLTRLLMPYSDVKWPARTGVESLMHQVMSGRDVHPRGQALPLRAGVTRGDDQQRIYAHYRQRIDGVPQAWQTIVLTHQGGGVHERLLDTSAPGLTEIDFYFATDDDQSTTQRIAIVPPPSVRRATLTVQPPAYAAGRIPDYQAELGQGLDARAITDTPSLIGSDVTLRLVLNKPLPVETLKRQNVKTSKPADAGPDERATPVASEEGPDRPRGESDFWLTSTFGWSASAELPQFSVDPAERNVWILQWRLAGTQALSLKLVDEHGLSNVEPIAYRIEAVEDRLPAVTVTAPAADEAVLASATIAVETEARDDVALRAVGIQAHRQAGEGAIEDALAQQPQWQIASDAAASSEGAQPTIALQGELNLAPLNLKDGDVVLVSGVAEDVFELDGQRHPQVRSPLRKLRVISELEFASQLRRQLGAVRQNAIRVEAQQAELQDHVIDRGIPHGGAGLDRAQAQIGERVAQQRQAIRDIERQMRQNRLDDSQLAEILRQTNDLLDAAGSAANRAVESIETAARETSKRQNVETSKQSDSRSEPAREEPDAANAPNNEPAARESGNPEERAPNREQPDGTNDGASPNNEPNEPLAPGSAGGADAQEPPQSHEDVPVDRREVVQAQQEVRDELTDLIKLLDRDEDTWVVKKQLESLLQEQTRLEEATQKLGDQTMGKQPDDLTPQERSDLDRIARKQRDLRDEARKLTEQMRQRADALQQVDPRSAESMRNAADTAEQQRLQPDMEQAAQQVQQNQMTSAQGSQQRASQTLQRMLQQMQETPRAQAQQLLRQLASLLESIKRLVAVQENELTSLAMAIDVENFGGLDRSMIRLNQNTQAVAGEARAAGQEARRIARSLDRAADAQGAAVVALRAQPVNGPAAQEAEERSLALLKEALEQAQELEQQTQEQEARRRREELIAAYRGFAEQQVALREQTLPLVEVEELDRRQLVEARRLGSSQDEIRTGLNQLRDITSEILDSIIFSHVHRMIDHWSSMITDKLVAAQVSVEVTDRQQLIADSIGRLIEALEEAMAPPDEFARDQSSGSEGQGEGGGQPPLIPDIAQLRLLRGLQIQVYDQTKDLDSRDHLDAAQRRTRLRELGDMQRELKLIGEQLLESLQQQLQQRPQPGPETPPDADPQPPAEPQGGNEGA